ncbi:MAG: divergent polysaccharide deacetylase family protein [Candidatus Marinimicrobia bacterium]|nr:divergent polysaccharide deacetylase family protein [Candidatus Neomarinimicrobiota bacterium]
MAKRVRYLKSPYGIILRKIRDEKRLKYLFLVLLGVIAFLVYYFFPVSRPSESYILAEGYRKYVIKIKEDIKRKGFELVDISKLKGIDLPKGTLVFEIGYEQSLKEREQVLFKVLARNGFEVYKRLPVEEKGFVYFVSYSGKPVGYFILMRKGYRELLKSVTDSFFRKPRIAVIIDDFGYGYDEVVRGFLGLDVKLNISIIPGHRYSRMISVDAVNAGKEVLIHMPMEAVEANRRYNDTEQEFMIKADMSSVEVNERINLAVMELPEAKGMNNHMGSLVTVKPDIMRVVAMNLKKKNLYFVDSLTSPQSVAYSIMKEEGVKVGVRSVFLDNELDFNEIKAKFDKLKKIARRKGKAIGIGHVKRETLEVLRQLIRKGYFSDVIFVFASEVVE